MSGPMVYSDAQSFQYGQSMARVWPVRFLIILGLQTLGHVYYSPLLSMLRHKWLCLFSAIKNLFLCQFAMGVR